MFLEHINNLTGVPHNPPSRTLGPNKQPSADNLFHHAPANTGRECLNACVFEREREREGSGCSSRARVLHQARVQGISTSFPSPVCTREALEPVLSAPLNTHTYSRVHLLLHTSSMLFSFDFDPLLLAAASAWQPQRGSPSLPARGPGRLPALAWVVGWGGWGDLGALKLSSGAPAALPAHPSWPASPQIDSSALLIRSLVTVGGRVCVCVCMDRRLYRLGVALVFLSILSSLAVHRDCLSQSYFSASFSLSPLYFISKSFAYHLFKSLNRLFSVSSFLSSPSLLSTFSSRILLRLQFL